MMTELMARNLSAKELAETLRYHSDPAVSRLAVAVVNGDLEGPDLAQELRDAQDDCSEAESRASALEDVLRGCLDELSDIDSDSARQLVKEINDVI